MGDRQARQAASPPFRKRRGQMVVLALVAASHILSLAACVAPDAQRSPCVTWTGAHAPSDASGCFRIRSPAEWQRIWAETTGRSVTRPADVDTPIVDFEACEVIAVFAGRTENCRGLEATSFVLPRDTAELRFTRQQYQSMEQAEPATPYGFFVVPRSKTTLRILEGFGVGREALGVTPRWELVAEIPSGEV